MFDNALLLTYYILSIANDTTGIVKKGTGAIP